MTRRFLSVLSCLSVLAIGAACVAQPGGPAPGDRGGMRAGRGFDGPVVMVSGTATVEREPDRATISLGITQREKTAEEAQVKANTVMSAIIDKVKALNITGAQIQTSGISLFPIYEQRRYDQSGGEPTEPKIIGVQASSSITVRIDDVKRIGEVIDSSIKNGANNVNGVSFELKNDGPAKSEALEIAVRDAAAKAGVMARASGHRLGHLVELAESSAARPIPFAGGRAMAMAMEADISSSPTPVEGGKITVTANVTALYHLLPPE